MSSATLATLPAGQRIVVGRIAAAHKMPYFSVGVASLVATDAPGLGTLGVTRHGHLLVDVEEISKLTGPQLGTVLLHEYLHRYFQHAERLDVLIAVGTAADDSEDRRIWNIAGDAEINCNLRDAGCDFPPEVKDGFAGAGGAIFPESFGCQPHRRAEEYFHHLKKIQAKARKTLAKQLGKGCGSGAGGVTLEGEPPASDENARSEVEQALQRKADAAAVTAAVQASKSAYVGKVPAGIARHADAICAPAKVRWEQKLSRTVRSAVTFIAGQGDYTWERRARVQGALEASFGAECPVLPGEHAPRAEVAFAVDTSGSIGEAELQTIVREAAGVLRSMGGARLTFLCCDAKVHGVTRIRRPEEIRKNLKGGGGTAFAPVFEALKTQKPRPDVLIYATDGEAWDVGELEAPRGMAVIWLMVGGGRNQARFGEEIQVDA